MTPYDLALLRQRLQRALDAMRLPADVEWQLRTGNISPELWKQMEAAAEAEAAYADWMNARKHDDDPDSA